MNLEKIVREFLERENLVNENIGVAVSGGVDSVVLFNLVSKVHNIKKILVLHVNHGTRSACKQEQQEVEEMCKTFGVKFLCKNIVITPEKNMEAEWRKERKDFFEEAKIKHNLNRILTAHHATDLVETMIWRLTKGCGVSGLSPFDISTKPLWKVPKKGILEYAKSNKLKWSEDESNLNTNFERNKIRHKVIPVLRTITPNLEQVYVREAETFAEVADFVEKSLPEIRPVELKEFLEWSLTIQSEFLRRIAKKTPSGDELADCLRWLHNNPEGDTKKMLGGTKIIFKEKVLSWE